LIAGRVIAAWSAVVLLLDVNPFLGRTRPAGFAHSGAHAELGQHPDLQGDPQPKHRDGDEEFHFKGSKISDVGLHDFILPSIRDKGNAFPRIAPPPKAHLLRTNGAQY
jgi:hypothetical protein